MKLPESSRDGVLKLLELLWTLNSRPMFPSIRVIITSQPDSIPSNTPTEAQLLSLNVGHTQENVRSFVGYRASQDFVQEIQ